MKKNSTEYIRIHTRPFRRQRNISCRLPFFKGETVIKIEHDKILFTKPTIDHQGKVSTFSEDKSGCYHATVTCELPLGWFKIDEEESNEDCVVVYY